MESIFLQYDCTCITVPVNNCESRMFGTP